MSLQGHIYKPQLKSEVAIDDIYARRDAWQNGEEKKLVSYHSILVLPYGTLLS